MKMKCRECGTVHDSKTVREEGLLTYVTNDVLGWHHCVDGAAPHLDDLDKTVPGYDGCRGWP